LDETYERTLLEIGKEKWTYAYRLFQCVAAAIRPLRVEELAEFLTFDFEAGGSPIFRADWRSEDPRDTVLSTCSALISIVNADGWPVVQFSHFSVKEYLISSRILEGRVSRYHIPLEPAHVIMTQACLSLLLHLDDHITDEQIQGFPLVNYAARYWIDHAGFEDVSSHAEDAMKRLFDPRKHHFAVWIRTYDLDGHRIASPRRKGTPLYYAAHCGFHIIAEWLVTTCSQNVMALGGHFRNPVYVASRHGHHEVVEILLKHNAAAVNMPGLSGWAPLHAASLFGHLGVSRALLEFGAVVDGKTPSENRTPLSIASEGGHMEIAALLLENCADLNIRDRFGRTPLYRALQWGHPGLVQMLLAHGVDPNFRDEGGRTLLHVASGRGNLNVLQGLLDLGANVHVRDNQGQTPLQVVSGDGQDEITELLLKHGAERIY
jgi:ankyrin repeat protein